MKTLSVIVSGLMLTGSFALASDALVKKAKDAGLKPIPQSKQ